MKLTSSHIKEIAKLNPKVAARINEAKKRHNLRNVSFSAQSVGYQHYMGEGEQIDIFAPTGKSASVEMISENTVGAAALKHSIGYSPRLPEGTWIVTVGYYQGYHISVNYVGVPQLSGVTA